MKKTTQAVKYALDTLHISPTELFALIESSQGYEGDIYERWLANRIIGVAESEGIPFTELLVKRLHILASISESAEKGLSSDLVDFINGEISKYSNSTTWYAIKDFSDTGFLSATDLNGVALEDISNYDWLSPVSLDSDDLEELLHPRSVFIGELSGSTVSAKSSLVLEAKKNWGIPVKSQGGATLFRLALTNSWVGSKDNLFIFLSDEGFFRDNADVVGMFSEHFVLRNAVYLSRNDAMPSRFGSGKVIVTVWSSTDLVDDTKQLMGMDLVLSASNFRNPSESAIFYADRGVLMEDYLADSTRKYLSDKPLSLVPTVDLDTNLADEVGISIVESDLGYLSLNGTQRVATLPVANSRGDIPITEENLYDIIAFYGASQASEGHWGYGRGLNVLLNGIDGYNSLVANCLPVFLFGPNSLFFTKMLKDSKGKEIFTVGAFGHDTILGKQLYENLSPYMSFEAKVLYDLVVSYLTAMYKKDPNLEGLSLHQVRELVDNPKFNKAYQEKLESALAFIRQQVRSNFVC